MSLPIKLAKLALLIALTLAGLAPAAAQTPDLLSLPPVGRVRLAAVHAKTDLKSGTGRGRVTTKLNGKQIEALAFQTTFDGDKYAVTVPYPQPRKERDSIKLQTMVTDGFLTFGTVFSERIRRDGYETSIWRNGKSDRQNAWLVSTTDIFPYDVTKLCRRAIDVPQIMDKYDVKLVSADGSQAQMNYTIGKKTLVTFTTEAHSGFNVTQLAASVDNEVRQSYRIAWDRSGDVWHVHRFYEKWLRSDALKTDEYERTLEYDDFQPNIEIDEKMFDLSRVEDGWYNDRLMYPHGKP
jgi:hypothetical protein